MGAGERCARVWGLRWWACEWEWEQVLAAACRYGVGYKKGGNVLENEKQGSDFGGCLTANLVGGERGTSSRIGSASNDRRSIANRRIINCLLNYTGFHNIHNDMRSIEKYKIN
jgi:hypothetical protein